MGFYVLQKADTALSEVPRKVVDVASPVRESMQMWSMGPKTSMHKTHFLMKWLRCTGSTNANMSRILDSTRLPFQLSLVSFSFYRTQVSLGSDLWVLISLSPTPFADLTDVTLADGDSNSIPTDYVNGQSQAMWQCKWRHLVAKIETNAS